MLGGLGTFSALVVLWWEWQRRREARPARQARPAAAAERATEAAASAPTVPARGRPKAQRVLVTVSVLLTIVSITLVAGLVQGLRLMRDTSYRQLVPVAGDLPARQSVDACDSGLCPVTHHWDLTGDTRHVEVSYAGLARRETQRGKAVLGVAAPGCGPSPQVLWQAVIDGEIAASGIAGPGNTGKVLDVTTGQTITMIVDRATTTPCTVDLRVSWIVFFAPDEAWRFMNGRDGLLEA
ncbi:hypothetical protein ACFQ1L_17160 [Phytohabitans flavus]|uniref:hypothetical protein n=1 Tax=Phytohabitans flavus TaxID=1076124 RepID=UPI001565A64B